MTADGLPLPADAAPTEAPEPAADAGRGRRRTPEAAIPSRRERSVPHAGWMVVAGKEFADHLWSPRFVVLLAILGIVALIPMYFVADAIRSAAGSLTGQSSFSLFMSTGAPSVGDTGVQIPSALTFVTWVGPLLGIVFAFDAVNGERSAGTLPRLLSQPIYRDDVINGKFAAGLSVIGLVLTLVVGIIAAFGIIRLGIVPGAEDVLRILLWLVVTFLYIAIWLAFGLLLSVLVRGAATSALVGFGVWFLLTILGGFQWRGPKAFTPVLSQVGERIFLSKGLDPRYMGGGGWNVFRFRAEQSGKVTLTFDYGPFDLAAPATKTVRYEITVE